MNFMLFDPSGKLLSAHLSTNLTGCLMMTGNNQQFIKGKYLLFFDPIFPHDGFKDEAYKRINIRFAFPKGMSSNHENINWNQGMRKFIHNIGILAESSNVEKDYFLDD